ncbi:MAG: biotin--[acetyl-CoA-carboxylase] ligase [Chthoniobacterales bacterium]
MALRTFDIDPDRVRDAVGGRVTIYRETASTNDLVRQLALSGAAEGEVVVADRQTNGRGQFGRRWDSAAGLGLWFSLLLRPAWASQLDLVTPLVAVAVATGIEKTTGICPRIKLPNDVLFDRRKVAGILTEARSGKETFAVVGIGVNVSHAATDFPIELQSTATSLELATGSTVDREALLISILGEIHGLYSRHATPTTEVLDLYAALSRRPDCGSFPA